MSHLFILQSEGNETKQTQVIKLQWIAKYFERNMKLLLNSVDMTRWHVMKIICLIWGQQQIPSYKFFWIHVIAIMTWLITSWFIENFDYF